jgi:hypothetical protein
MPDWSQWLEKRLEEARHSPNGLHLEVYSIMPELAELIIFPKKGDKTSKAA